MAPVKHGELLELRWQAQEGGLCRFEIRRAKETTTVLSGTLEDAA
jgi:hypothetical protein